MNEPHLLRWRGSGRVVCPSKTHPWQSITAPQRPFVSSSNTPTTKPDDSDSLISAVDFTRYLKDKRQFSERCFALMVDLIVHCSYIFFRPFGLSPLAHEDTIKGGECDAGTKAILSRGGGRPVGRMDEDVRESREFEHELVECLKAPPFLSLSVDSEFFRSLDKRPLVELTSVARSVEGRAKFAELGIVPSLVVLFQRFLKISSVLDSSLDSSPESSSAELLNVLLLLLKLTRNLCAGDYTNQDAFLDSDGVGVLATTANVLLLSVSRQVQGLNGSDGKDSMLERITAWFGSAGIVSTQGQGHRSASPSVGCLQMMLQLLGNFARRGEACQAAVWERFFPTIFLELATLRVKEIYGPLSMVLYTCCHGNSKRCWDLCQGDGTALVALLIIATVDDISDEAPGNASSSWEQIDWFDLLMQHVCLLGPLFPLLFVNLGVPPLIREVDHSKVNADELMSICRLCLESSTLTSLQASLLYILCDCLSSQECTPCSDENEQGARGLPMPLQSMCFMVDVLRMAAQGAVKDVELTPVPTLTSASCNSRILGFVLSLWKTFLASDNKHGDLIQRTRLLLSHGFVDLLLSLLEALGPPEARGRGDRGGMPQEYRAPNGEGKYPGKNPYLGYRRDIVAVIGNLSHENSLVQDRVRENGSLLLVLQQCHVETENPFLREWGLWAMRNLLEGNERNQVEISQLEVKESINLPELQKMGISIEIDPNTRRPRLVNESASSVQP